MITKIINEEDIHKIQTYIQKGDKFVIISHVSPDGDAIGSSLGFYHFLKAIGKENVHVIMPNAFPSFYNWMPKSEIILNYEEHENEANQALLEADVIFCLDFNEPKRVEKMTPVLLKASGRKVLIDHHLNPSDFCRVTISYPIISSTSELIFRIICRMSMFSQLNIESATCIYVGMMTDTGAFTYNSNQPEIYNIISELLKKGIDKDWIYRQVMQQYTESRLRLMGYMLHEKMKYYKSVHTALLVLTKEEMEKFHYQSGDAEGFVNLPLSISDVQFSVFIREDQDQIKISLRSVGNFPCNLFAAEYFNGGGHKNASGAEFSGTIEKAIEVFESALEKFNPTNYNQKKK